MTLIVAHRKISFCFYFYYIAIANFRTNACKLCYIPTHLCIFYVTYVYVFPLFIVFVLIKIPLFFYINIISLLFALSLLCGWDLLPKFHRRNSQAKLIRRGARFCAHNLTNEVNCLLFGAA